MYLSTLHVSYSRRYTRLSTYTLIFIQEGYIQEGQPQFGQKIKKFIHMMTSLLLNKASRLNSDFKLLIRKNQCTMQVKESSGIIILSRILLVLCFAGSGYVDPDEHFDTVEPVAADVFDFKASHGSVNSPSAQPIRYTFSVSHKPGSNSCFLKIKTVL